MAVFTDLQHLPHFRNAVLTIGTFDGVHKGHQAILRNVAEHARQVNGESVLITFDPHPRKLLYPDQPLGIITPLDEKVRLITAAGIQHVVVAPFTLGFAGLSASEYITSFLVAAFHPHSIIIGYDHRFGNDRKGDLKLLEEYASPCHYELVEIPEQIIDDAAVSSTKIRNAINRGMVDEAANMLGRYYSLKGTVVHGAHLGRTLGYPTANVHPNDSEQIIPAIGIYAIRAVHNGAEYDGMLSIGYNPTVTDRHELRIEANLFNFSEEIYGRQLELCFVRRLRDEQKFDSIEALAQQLHRDKEETLAALAQAKA